MSTGLSRGLRLIVSDGCSRNRLKTSIPIWRRAFAESNPDQHFDVADASFALRMLAVLGTWCSYNQARRGLPGIAKVIRCAS